MRRAFRTNAMAAVTHKMLLGAPDGGAERDDAGASFHNTESRGALIMLGGAPPPAPPAAPPPPWCVTTRFSITAYAIIFCTEDLLPRHVSPETALTGVVRSFSFKAHTSLSMAPTS